MTTLYFVMVALPPNKKGETPIHMFLENAPRVRDKDIVAERQAIRDIHWITEDLLRENVTGDENRLLKDGAIPLDGEPVCSFAIACQYDPERDIAHYKGIDLIWISKNKRFSRVPAYAQELYDLTFGTLKKREKIETKRKSAPKWKFDREDLAKTREYFTQYCATITDKIAHKRWVRDTNARRFECVCLKNGYCTPPNFKCPCYCNGRCIEVK